MAHDTYQAVSPTQSLIFINFVHHHRIATGPAFTFLPCAEPDYWAAMFAYADLARIPEADFEVGGRRYGVYGHDWRVLPPKAWQELLARREIAASAQAVPPSQGHSEPLVVLSQPEFIEAIRTVCYLQAKRQGRKTTRSSTMMRSGRRLALVPPGKGKSPWMKGNLVTCKVVSEDLLGAYSLFEVTVKPQGSLPPHVHHWEQQAYNILDGELLIQAGDRTFTATVGSFVDVPKGILHTFRNVGTVPVRLLAIVTPAWYGKFFEDWVSQRKTPRCQLRLVHKT